HPGTREPVLDELFHLFFELAFASADDGGHDHDTVFRGQGHDPLDNLLSGLSGNGPAAFGAMRHADRGVEKTKVIIDFGNGPYGRSGTAAGGFLLDRYGGAQAVDGVNVGTFHLIKE